jgi:hypothetical protein
MASPYIQLAIALLAHHRGDEGALKLYNEDDEWVLDSADIERAIENATPVPMDLNELLRRVRGG